MESANSAKRVKLNLVAEAEAKQKAKSAMQNEKILTVIGKKMNVSDLWTLRQTGTLWNGAFVPALRDDKDQQIIKLACVEVNQTQARSIGDYTTLMRTSGQIPFAKYTLVDAHTNAANPEEVAEFFRVCGSSIKSLDLSLGSKSLEICKETQTNNFQLVQLLKDEMRWNSIGHLKTLKIYRLRVPELDILLELANRQYLPPLRLGSFSTSIEYSSTQFSEIVTLLCKFLKAQRDNLREFCLATTSRVDDRGDRRMVRIILPDMPSLRSLSVQCYGPTVHGPLTVQPLRRAFPGLIRLEYVGERWPADIDQFGHRGATDLSLDVHEMQPDAFEGCVGSEFQLAAVTSLEIKLGSNRIAIFRQICAREFTSLQVFKLHLACDVDVDVDDGSRKVDLDELLTGVEKERMSALGKELNREAEAAGGGLTVDKLRSILRWYKHEPGIQNLGNLKKLAIVVARPGYRLTNIGGYFGLVLAADGSTRMQHISIEVESNEGASHGHKKQSGRSIGNSVTGHCERMIRRAMSRQGQGQGVLRFN